ncbi:MAG TPA: hypothetical protein VN442_01760 [Bryobacteraceae bacterium]|nr:hypothetical protein [Bryobacteraceae bacterium]
MKRGLTFALALLACGCARQQQQPPTTTAAAAKDKKLIARIYNSGFPQGHDTYNGMGAASDGRIYYVLSSQLHDVAGRMYSLDPKSGEVKLVADLTEAVGEKDSKMIAQGKSHVNFTEYNGKLYFSTHLGYYSIIDDMEKPGIPPAGWKQYAGGHLLAYDLKSGKFEDFGIAPKKEGVLTTSTDGQRGRIYGITWPTGYFFRYDIAKKEMKDLGPFFLDGENGKGARYRTVCRSIPIDPRDGSAYFTDGDGTIYRYSYEKDAVERVQGDNMKKDYLGLYDPKSAGHMAYNWRQVIWYAPENKFYGVHGNSGYLFSFDPKAEKVEILDRLTSEPSKLSGMYDQFSYGYLGFTLGPDGKTLYYLTGGPIYENGKRVTGKDVTGKGEAKGLENLHLITYDIPTRKYTDNGPVFYPNGDRPLYVNSIAVAKDGTVYTLARITEGGHTRTDLISFKP